MDQEGWREEQMSSSGSNDFGTLPDSLKRRWVADSFDREFEEQKSRQRCIEQYDAAIAQLWKGVVTSAAKSIMSHGMTLPWERGIAGLVLGAAKEQFLQVPNFLIGAPARFLQEPDPTDVHKSDRAAIITRLEAIPGAWTFAAQRLSALSLRGEKKADARNLALSKWREVLIAKPEASVLGRTLLSDLLAFKTDIHLTSVIQDVFAMKATATIDKRANHLLLFMAYCRRGNLEPFPVTEPNFYAFLRDEQSSKSPTSATSCRESMRLAASIIGLDGAAVSADSPRVAGICHRLLLKKRPRKQAKVLTRVQIIKLERILMEPKADLADRVAAGHCLFLVFGRIRWTDAECVENLDEDITTDNQGYLQANALGSKTSITAMQKTAFFPFVMTVNALETPLWHRTWLRLRQRAGLVKLPRAEEDRDSRTPFMPSVLMGGSFGSVAMTSDEGSRILRALLRHAGEKEDQVAGVSTHSLKATVLSWLRKWGADPFHSKVAGYHSIQGEGSMFSYARDNVAATLRVIDDMLDQIRSGVFNPDSTRSGYFDLRRSKDAGGPSRINSSNCQPTNLPACALQDQDVPSPEQYCEDTEGGVELQAEFPDFGDEVVDVEELHNVSIQDDSSSSESSSSESDAGAIGALSFLRAPALASSSFFAVHNFNKTLHKCRDDSHSVTACGRKLHEGYTAFDHEPLVTFHNCAVCFGTVVSVEP